MRKGVASSNKNFLCFANDSYERWWRFDMPAKWLERYTNIRFIICTLDNWFRHLDQVDHVVGRSFISPKAVGFFHRVKKKIYYELDGAEPFYKKQYLSSLGVKQKFTHKRNLMKTISTSDGVLVSTEKLARWVEKFYKGQIIQFPNLMDFEWWDQNKVAPLNKSKDKIRVGWFGMRSHLFDIKHILVPIMSEFKNNKKVTFYLPDSVAHGIPHSLHRQVVFIPPWSIHARPVLAKNLGIDIMLAPLEVNMFNACKSPIKYFENAADRIAGIYSPVPYGSYVKHNYTGLLASGIQDWVRSIRRLIEDSAFRAYIGENARRHVYQRHNAASGYIYWKRALDILTQQT